MISMNKEELKKLLPHREPMLLLDEAELVGDEAHGKITITGDEYFLQGHFPGNPVVPGVIQCEMLAQNCCVLLMGAYAFLVYRGIRIAMRCKDRFGSLLAAGITSVIGMQAIVNIAVATSSAPTTGQTLPFISAGGTSLVIFLSAAGILLNVSRNTQ